MGWGMAEATATKPVAGVDYPRTLMEFQSFFPEVGLCSVNAVDGGTEGSHPRVLRRRP
jgi:hypothetical protein